MYRRRIDFGDVLDIALTTVAYMFALSVVTFTVVAFFVYMPVSLTTEAECLERGYPKSKITYKLNRYCMNLEGTVTVTVDELTKEKEDE